MQGKLNRFVIDRENNVVWVDFGRDPDPPAPKFPGAGGLREIGDEGTSTPKRISAAAFEAAAKPNFFNIDDLPKSSAAKHDLEAPRGTANDSPDGQGGERRVARGSIAA